MNLKAKMKRFWTLNRHHAEGFTLVELIVVIAILAILGGVAVPAYGAYIEKANKASDEQLLAALNKAYATACMENGEFDMLNLSFGPVATLNEGAVKMNKFDDSFQRYFENGIFKYYDTLGFVSAEGVFKGNTIAAIKEALKAAWDASSMAAGGEEVVKTLLGAYDGIGGFFTAAVEMGMDLDLEALLPHVPDTLIDALGFEGMFGGFNDSLNLSDKDLDAYLEKYNAEYAALDEDGRKAWRENPDNNYAIATIKGNIGVLHFANDAAGRELDDVKSSVDNYVTLLGYAFDEDMVATVSDAEVLQYYKSTLKGDDLARFEGMGDDQQIAEANATLKMDLGDLKLDAKQVVMTTLAVEGLTQAGQDVSNTAGASTLGSMYALAAGYYNSDYYSAEKLGDKYDPDYKPDFSQFGSFITAMDQPNFQEYYQNQGGADLEAYLNFMEYVAAGDVDMSDPDAFAGQYGYIADALGYSSGN